jgi:uncharacterized membrane protein
MGKDAREREEGSRWPSDQAMAQLYRGELGRSDRWRTRLDTTSNWALTTTAAVISFGFATPTTPHVTILVGIWLVVMFLLIEARRYRYYDLWNRRTRLLEDGFWAPKLRHEPVDPDAMRELAVELERPQIVLSLFSAVSTRLNRAYGPILLLLCFSWFVKVYSYPEVPHTFREFVGRAHVGPLPGWWVMSLLFTFLVCATALFILSFMGRAPLGELRTRPRGPRTGMLQAFYRPYAVRRPRQRVRRLSPAGPPPSPPQRARER